jgi:VIT1/CCC1 family predicted Fe2+/Mn2+ transporter
MAKNQTSPAAIGRPSSDRRSNPLPPKLDHPIGDPELEIGHEHRDVSGGWLRPTVFGVVDGLVSNFSLIAAVAAASTTAEPVLLAGIAGLFGGAFSMGAGEYISVKSQNESMQAEVDLERHELVHNTEAEIAELAQIYVNKGVDPELAQLVAEQLSADPETALEVHAQEELGVDIHDLPNARLAAVSSFASFSVGAFVPLVPFLFAPRTLPIAAVLALIALFVTGATTSRFTSRSWWYAGSRQMLVGLFSAAVTYGIGHLFGATVA